MASPAFTISRLMFFTLYEHLTQDPAITICTIGVALSSVKIGLQGGRFASEWVAGIDRNQWPLSIGIDGRLGSEYAAEVASEAETQSRVKMRSRKRHFI
jgi:hypothetical protein